jgi:putative addiction module component (TIGR02574 family)
MTRILEDVLKLNLPERILLVEAIWDSIANNDEHLQLSPETKQLLDTRLEDHKNQPHEGSGWDEVKARIKANSSA